MCSSDLEPLFVPRTTPVKRLFLTFKQKKVHMAIVVSEYGKLLGLVTMDDLLAQIFGVLRDERAELQNTIPPGRLARVPEGRSDISTGPIPRQTGGARDGQGAPDGQGAAGAALDPPPRPIHDVDEATPPATDLAELQRPGPGRDGQESSS